MSISPNIITEHHQHCHNQSIFATGVISSTCIALSMVVSNVNPCDPGRTPSRDGQEVLWDQAMVVFREAVNNLQYSVNSLLAYFSVPTYLKIQKLHRCRRLHAVQSQAFYCAKIQVHAIQHDTWLIRLYRIDKITCLNTLIINSYRGYRKSPQALWRLSRACPCLVATFGRYLRSKQSSNVSSARLTPHLKYE